MYEKGKPIERDVMTVREEGTKRGASIEWRQASQKEVDIVAMMEVHKSATGQGL